MTHIWREEVAHLPLQADSSSPDGCGGANVTGVSAEVGMHTDSQILHCFSNLSLHTAQTHSEISIPPVWDILKI